MLIADTRYPLHNFFADMASATGERRQFQLADGSDFLLDARSRVNVDFAAQYRNISFTVGCVVGKCRTKSRPPPYRSGTIRSLGTRFMVRQEAGRSLVVVQEHEVSVTTANGMLRNVEAGNGVRFDGT